MYLSSIGPVPLLLFLLSALHEIRNPCRQSEVVRIISGLLLLLFATGLGPGLALRPGAPEAALAAVDAVVAGRQLWRTVSGAGPDTGAWTNESCCHASLSLSSHLFLVLPLPEDPEEPLPATLYGSSSLLPAPGPR